MLWKVFKIDTGKILKAGFRSEFEAKDWLELKGHDFQDLYEIDEMDPDEEEEWYEAHDSESDDEDSVSVMGIDDEDEQRLVGFGEDYYDGADLSDDEDQLVYLDEE